MYICKSKISKNLGIINSLINFKISSQWFIINKSYLKKNKIKLNSINFNHLTTYVSSIWLSIKHTKF